MTQQAGTAEATLAEKKRLLAEKKKALETKRALAAELFDKTPDGVVILTPTGAMTNEVSNRMFGVTEGDDWKTAWRFFDLETGVEKRADDLGAMKAMMGQASQGYEEMKIVLPPPADPVYIASYYGPLPNGGATAVYRNLGSRVQAEQELRDQQERLVRANEEHRMLIGRLRGALDELATPVLRVANGVLVIPLIGVLDSQRAASVGERVLAEIVQEKAGFVVFDVTGVEVLDTSTADHLARIARSVSLLGATCMLSGVQPEVAQTLVALGIKLTSLAPHINLERALAACRKIQEKSEERGNGKSKEEDEEEER